MLVYNLGDSDTIEYVLRVLEDIENKDSIPVSLKIKLLELSLPGIDYS